MARPPKKGLDYFPLNCHPDTKTKLVEANFGLLGFAITVKLWQQIYADEGYYMVWDEDTGLLFAKDNNIEPKLASDVVDECIKRGIFNQEKFQKYSILTSKGIQERYLMMTEKRTGIKILDEYAVLNAPSELVSAEKTGVSSPETGVSDGSNATKESKRKESKEKEIKQRRSTPAKHQYGEYHHVLLTDDQYQKLAHDYSNPDELITFLDEYIEMKGYKAKNHYLAIRKWVVDAVNERHQKESRAKRLPNWWNHDADKQGAEPEVSDAELRDKMRKLSDQYDN